MHKPQVPCCRQERVESPQPSVVHVGVSRFGELRSCCPGALALVHRQEAVTDLGVSASGDDALDLRVVGQVAHGVLNVY